jgi:hypothetical protein
MPEEILYVGAFELKQTSKDVGLCQSKETHTAVTVPLT